MDEFYAIKFKSVNDKDFKMINILHNFSLEDFQNNFPTSGYRKLIFSNEGIDIVLKKIKTLLKE